jgi:hypothetical protein
MACSQHKKFSTLSKSGWPARHGGGGQYRHANGRRRRTMQYLLMIYSQEGQWSKMTDEQKAHGLAAYGAYTEALNAAGVRIGSNRLRDTDTATTVKIVNGEAKVLDGPYADTKEQLGGYFLIDVPDLDTALSWAARCPGASHGTMEVRPIWAM